MMFLLLDTSQTTGHLELYQGDKLQAAKQFETKALLQVLPQQIQDLLAEHKLDWSDLKGVGVFAGPGSFTGLRLSHAWANALAYSLELAAANDGSSDWRKVCLQKTGQWPAPTGCALLWAGT